MNEMKASVLGRRYTSSEYWTVLRMYLIKSGWLQVFDTGTDDDYLKSLPYLLWRRNEHTIQITHTHEYISKKYNRPAWNNTFHIVSLEALVNEGLDYHIELLNAKVFDRNL